MSCCSCQAIKGTQLWDSDVSLTTRPPVARGLTALTLALLELALSPRFPVSPRSRPMGYWQYAQRGSAFTRSINDAPPMRNIITSGVRNSTSAAMSGVAHKSMPAMTIQTIFATFQLKSGASTGRIAAQRGQYFFSGSFFVVIRRLCLSQV